jgi:hypothetical protein
MRTKNVTALAATVVTLPIPAAHRAHAYDPHDYREVFRRAAEMPEPPYRMVERILPFSSHLSDEENRQLRSSTTV